MEMKGWHRHAKLLAIRALHQVIPLNLTDKGGNGARSVVDVHFSRGNNWMPVEFAVSLQVLAASIALTDYPSTAQQLDLVRACVLDGHGIPKRKLPLEKVRRLVEVNRPYGHRDVARGRSVANHRHEQEF